MSGKIKYTFGFGIMVLGHVVSLALYLHESKTFIFRDYLHSDCLNMIGYPAVFFGAIFAYLARGTYRLDWFGKLLLSLLFIGWLTMIYLFFKELYLQS